MAISTMNYCYAIIIGMPSHMCQSLTLHSLIGLCRFEKNRKNGKENENNENMGNNLIDGVGGARLPGSREKHILLSGYSG